MKVLLTVVLFFSIFTSFSQNINGKVLEVETNTPIESVNVYLKKTKEGTFTNKKGEFSLKLRSNLIKKQLKNLIQSCNQNTFFTPQINS
ncbi:carboxypeptidase-like regulatory domain-containing protein [Polaribacter sp.]|uniref:carboxypeptidase-like regulatory domain-containing protein n=1 Tax=Polaribacter sp. TaxID=1920175 RepID=UPI003F6A78DB